MNYLQISKKIILSKKLFYLVVYPPSIIIFCPVIYDDFLLSDRNIHASVISEGLQNLFIDNLAK